MFLDYWMIVVFILSAGFWGEWRFNSGLKKTMERIQQESSNAVQKYLLAEKVNVISGVLSFLYQNKVIQIDELGNIHGGPGSIVDPTIKTKEDVKNKADIFKNLFLNK